MVLRRLLAPLCAAALLPVFFIVLAPNALATRGPDVYLQVWGPASLARGAALRLTYTASNIGDQTAQGVYVVIRPPSGAVFAAGDQGCMRKGLDVVCYGTSPSGGFDLRPNERRSFAVTFEVASSVCGRTLYAEADAQTLRTSDPDLRNNGARFSTRTSCSASSSSYSSSGYQRFPDHTIVLDDENAVLPEFSDKRKARMAAYEGSVTEISGEWSQVGKTAGQDLLINTSYWTPRLSRGVYDVYMTWNPRDVSTIPTRLRFRVRASDLETHQLQDQFGAYVYQQRGVEPDGPMWAGRPWEKLGTMTLENVQNIMVSVEFAGSSALTRWTYVVDGIALVQRR